MTREAMAKRLLNDAALAVGLPPGDLDSEDSETRNAMLAMADAALAVVREAAEDAWKEAAVECRCERVCDCKTCNTYATDSWQSSDTRKKWAKEGGE